MAKKNNIGGKKQVSKNTKTYNNTKTISKKDSKLPYLILLGIIIFTSVLYSKSLTHGFVNWDDKEYFLQNNFIKNVSWQGVKDIFSVPYFSNYHPLTTLTWLIEYKYFGLSPEIFHKTNLLIHLINIFLVFIFIKMLVDNNIISVFAAFFFAIHPLHVESVAWNSERKDVLYSLFFLLSLIFYIYYLKNNNNLKYLIISFLLFVFSLLSKSMAVTLPVIMIIIDYYYNRKIISFKCIAEKIPFLILSIIIGIVTIYAQKSGNAISDLSGSYSYINRIFLISYSVSYYIIQLIFPFNLSVLHYYPEVKNNFLPVEYYLSLLFILLIIWLIIKSGKHRKFVIFGFLFFIISILPILQIVPVGQAIVAERYTYIPFIGLFLIIIIFFKNLISEKKQIKSYLYIAIAGISIYFSVITWNQVKIWENGITMWEDYISKNPDYYYGYYGIGNAYRDAKNYPQAITNYTKSIALKPSYAKGYNDRGVAKDYSKDYNGAIEDYNIAIKLDPKYEEAYINRAIDKGDFLKDINGALSDINIALSLNPNNSLAYFNRGVLFLTINDKKKACEDWQKALLLGNSNSEEMINKFCK